MKNNDPQPVPFKPSEAPTSNETGVVAHRLLPAMVPWEQPQYIKMLAESRKAEQIKKDSRAK